MKLDEETRSAGVFAELTSLALQLELPRQLVAALHRATADELAHAQLCQRMSASDAAPTPGHAEALQARFAGLSADCRLLSLLLVEVAMGETISSHLFRAGARSTREPRARAALAAIHRDEVQHARLGWEGLGLARARASRADLEWLREELPVHLGQLERQLALPALLKLESREPFDTGLCALGVLSPEARVEAFYSAMERKVIPSLEAAGLASASSWEQRYRSTT